MSEMVELKNDNPLAFILAGNCVFTVQNEESRNRFTYRVREPETQRDPARPIHFVDVLVGPDNHRDYQALGYLFKGSEYVHSNKSRCGRDCQSEKVFIWMVARLLNGGLPQIVKIYHHGYCGRCGRLLTVPSSIQLGLGPECAARSGW
jgi:hypothetical protein